MGAAELPAHDLCSSLLGTYAVAFLMAWAINSKYGTYIELRHTVELGIFRETNLMVVLMLDRDLYDTLQSLCW